VNDFVQSSLSGLGHLSLAASISPGSLTRLELESIIAATEVAEKEGTPELSVHRGGEPARHIPLRGATTIGRGAECDIVLPSRFVSRVHARLEPKGERFAIIDAGSKNGVFVNGRLLKTAHLLAPGDEVRIGEYLLMYGESPDSTTELFGELYVNVDSREVWIQGRQLETRLSVQEFQLLELLFSKAGRVCSRQEIGDIIWGAEKYDDNMIHRLVFRLKEKIEPDPSQPRYVVNVPGVGYKLERTGAG
jgi:pSer/pThr/pTyr-binding forkhead associated (FHA) protein